ncbi:MULTISPECIES: hypothetical protein [Agrobacterium]|uniref:hypothetical protein n=1 Tax=Agrobacterium TaxID=357 RepID=UPI001572C720|nr:MULTISPECIES: hypothetical protein [Agrobacterium]MCZ7850666.1 hypothetical protein [Agrobacterium salinitolerans]NTE33452.1 hypothetical protein [Agrobacterium tumefaciens]NTE48962.1 hypothetical protein [Agrobacterium tumefaciens]NTE54227.1 hypothetical protein [Agrobacterium tumefaciens]NTE70392.1 hypothetical protein [Agrobacterium tumefaciens]
MIGNSPPVNTTRILDQEKFRNAARAAGLQRVVFLAGPYIETAKPPRRNSTNKAAVLRYKLYHALEAEGWIVTLGEYEKLIDAADPLLGDHNNAALAEISHARSVDTDAIIMLPSSPGSFLELGAFSHLEDICIKMLIIVDAKYRDHKNYMNSGPIKHAQNNHADVQFIDYANYEDCWIAVQKHIIARARKKAARGIVAP